MVLNISSALMSLQVGSRIIVSLLQTLVSKKPSNILFSTVCMFYFNAGSHDSHMTPFSLYVYMYICIAVQTSMPYFHRMMGGWLRSPEEGADTIVWLCSSSAARRIASGSFFQGICIVFGVLVTPKYLVYYTSLPELMIM